MGSIGAAVKSWLPGATVVVSIGACNLAYWWQGLALLALAYCYMKVAR